MKKIYFSLLTALAGLSMQAQLTQANHAPTPSYTFQVYHCDSVNVSPGAAGPNTTWNFSTIATYSNVMANFIETATSNTAFPSATVAVASSANNTSYYNSTATQLNYYGGNIAVSQGGTSVLGTLTYTSPAVVAAYPMSINTSTTSTVGGSINVTSPASLNGTFIGTCHIVADGSGTLILPGTNATFTNVLRVVNTQTLNVTTSFISGTLTQVNYDYYAIGIRNPIFSINTATANLGFAGTSTQTTVTRDKNASATTATTTPPTPTYVAVYENQAAGLNLNVYPNPSSTSVNFATESPDARQVIVYDITGKLVDKLTFVDGKVKMDVSDLNTGLYMYSVTGSDNRTLKTGKLTVNH